ncbi:hypothetical protein PVK06_030467 [Gossypium arboreum]|uniref:Uncharacterized protein n=1 Tax=Gossypium arboreum TaxID=29729 RepID=A0ABR0NPF4_GOSAR|nr:hypothetical protein PVK06_030467 [Gossypium arboreum]
MVVHEQSSIKREEGITLKFLMEPSLQELAVSLQVLLNETWVASLDLVESINRAKIMRRENEIMYQFTRRALAWARKHYDTLAEANRRLPEENERLGDRIVIFEKDMEKLHRVIVGERADKLALEASLRKMDEEHKTVVANLTKSHEETMEKYKKETMQSLQEYSPDLKANFLLHAQIDGGLFDV